MGVRMFFHVFDRVAANRYDLMGRSGANVGK